MANQIPLKVMCDGSGNTCGLAQFTSSDSVAMTSGGTGLTTQGICEFTQPGLYVVGCQVTDQSFKKFLEFRKTVQNSTVTI